MTSAKAGVMIRTTQSNKDTKKIAEIGNGLLQAIMPFFIVNVNAL
jgi:hypothetical protein